MFKLKLRSFIIGMISAFVITGFVFADSIIKQVDVLYYNISIYLNNEKVSPIDADGNEIEPFIIDGTTYLPVRAIANTLGLSVEWNDYTKSIYLSNGDFNKQKVLKVVTNAEFPPYEYIDDNGAIAGIDIDIANYIAEKLGYEVQIINTEFSNIITMLSACEADMSIAGMTATEERKEYVDFWQPYIIDNIVMVVPENSDIVSVSDLNDKVIGVIEGTSGDYFISEDYNDNVRRYANFRTCSTDFYDGRLDAMVISNMYTNYIQGKVILTELNSESYSIATPLNSPLSSQIDDIISRMKQDGTLDKIVEKWTK